MAIFNEAYLQFLLEKKTTEEYHEEKFKKKYNYVPDKDSKDGRRGTITVDGKKYPVSMERSSKVEDRKRVKTGAYTADPDGRIQLGKEFFNMKGSHKNERMDAILQHEIGHQRFHNIHPYNKTVDDKDRTEKVYKYSGGLPEYTDKYMKNAGSKEDQKHRNDDFDKALKYSKTSVNSHTNAKEFEADRYAANHTSERAVRKAVSNIDRLGDKQDSKYIRNTINYRLSKCDTKSEKKLVKSNIDKQLAKANESLKSDENQRFKALKDEDLRNARTYKK